MKALAHVERIAEGTARESRDCRERLSARPDFRPELDFFLDWLLLSRDAAAYRERCPRPVVAMLCVQAPLEILDALGLQPVRLGGISTASQGLAVGGLPALACPFIRSSALDLLRPDSLASCSDLLVCPTTCDWNCKLPEIAGLEESGYHLMELPHMKSSERGQLRWLEETRALCTRIEKLAGRRLDRSALSESIRIYGRAWAALQQLTELRRDGRLAAVWYTTIACSFLVAPVREWTTAAEVLASRLESAARSEATPVFLAGSPIAFPHLRVLELLETCGLRVAGDELCTSERVLVGAPITKDHSLEGLLLALSERYHLACTCPTYVDNYRRVASSVELMKRAGARGAIYHLLAGCHPYAMESDGFESAVKGAGLRFIRVESDCRTEEGQSVRTRLEAFRRTLRSRKGE